MNTNVKAILSAIGIAAALASPVAAQPLHHHHKAAAAAPAGIHANASHGGYNAPLQTVYGPDVPEPAHNNGLNPDFQLGSEK